MLLKVFVKICEIPILLKLMEAIGPFVMKNILKVPVRVENVLDPLLSATTLVYGNVPQSKEKFILVSQKLPILYIFSENDILIGKKASYELVELLGSSASAVCLYNDQAVLVREGTATSNLKAVAFQEGSHYVFLKHPEKVNKEIANFLEQQK